MRFRGTVVLGLGWLVVLVGCTGPMSPEGRKFLEAGHRAYVGGDDKQAIESTSRCLLLHPRVEEAGEAYYIRGLARCRSGERASGEADLLAALGVAKRKDLLALASTKLGNLAYRLNNMKEAEARYRAALAQGAPDAPPADQAMFRLGCLLQRQGRWGEADVQFDRLIYYFDDSELARLAKQRVRAQRWSIQAAAVIHGSAAADFQSRLRRAGLTARVDLELRDGRMVRLVRVGSYSTRAEALADLKRVRTICGDAFATPAR